MANFFLESRLAKGLTQQQVADALGIKVQAVSSWERGLASPSTKFWHQVASILDVSIESMAQAISIAAIKRATQRRAVTPSTLTEPSTAPLPHSAKAGRGVFKSTAPRGASS